MNLATLLLLLSLLEYRSVIGNEYRIKDSAAFSNFVNDVNSGNSYKGTTVLLDNDITLSSTSPIGTSSSYQFQGTFDGQGYVINGYISGSYQYVGLFGYSSYGITIRNVILGRTYSVKSTLCSGSTYLGGLIGYCYSASAPCKIENSLNMRSVIYEGCSGSSYSYELYLGGIAGYLQSSSSYTINIKNCANYGSVTKYYKISYSYIGGIVGYFQGSSSKYGNIQNCLNHGTITHSGTTYYYLYIGGITGYSYYTNITNCVSAEALSLSSTATKDTYKGSIVGQVGSYTYINYCYWTSNMGLSTVYGDGSPQSTFSCSSYNSNSFELTHVVCTYNYTGTSFIDSFNIDADQYYLRKYSHWLLNKDKKTVTFTINDRETSFSMSSQVILLPDLIGRGNMSFYKWYADVDHTSPLTHFNVTDSTTLYGAYENNTNNYTVSFDTRGGTAMEPVTSQYNSVVPLQNTTTKEDCTFVWWENEYGDAADWNLVMPAHNITLHAVWNCTRIRTAEDFVSFSKVVNSGANTFTGMTVFLDADIDVPYHLSWQFSPIGTSSSYQFRGTFDGQGHIISNLTIISNLQYSGLFGYSSYGMTIKNVILDRTYSITSYYDYGTTILGGLIGYCYSVSTSCNIENSLNMGNVTFNLVSEYSYYLYLGGIAGYLQYSSYSINIKNCANYGSVTNSGKRSNSYIGGIVGYFQGSSSKYGNVTNCLNHGTITDSGTTSYLYIGGITGCNYYSYITNCASAGTLSLSGISTNNYLGGIVGQTNSGSYLYYCYWASNMGVNSLYGTGSPQSTFNCSSYDYTTFKLAQAVYVYNYTGTSLIDALNSFASRHYTYEDYSHWLLNERMHNVTFILDDKIKEIVVNYQVILMPDPSGGVFKSFSGWYADVDHTSPLRHFEVTGETTLYGAYENNTKNYTISFDTRGGTAVEPVTSQYNSVVPLQNTTTKEDCTFVWWENDYGDIIQHDFTVPAHNITLHAVWNCTRIRTAEDFVSFSKVVNSGANTFTGMTVFLDADIDVPYHLSWQFNPIGNTTITNKYFQGTFDGQGHIISNLTIISNLQYSGLFGYSYYGMTIKNVILDRTYSITSYYDYGDTYLGGLIGYCYSVSAPCNIENSLNMGSVTFDGNTGSYTLYLGGIAGNIQYSNQAINIKNCANYGSITNSGKRSTSYIGGVVGRFYGSSSSKYGNIQNCFNHGTITDSGTTSNLYIGGITGYSCYTYILNCLNAGMFSSYSYSGNIVGCVDSYTYLYYCYWTSSMGMNSIYGTGSPPSTFNCSSYNYTTFKLAQAVYVYNYTGTSLIDALNSFVSRHYTYEDYSHWLLNKDKKAVTFTINDRETSFSMSSQVILLPDLIGGGNMSFYKWYADVDHTSPLTHFNVTDSTTLYGAYENNTNNYTVSFDTRGGTAVEPIISQYNSVVPLQNTTTKEDCVLVWWENEYGDAADWNLVMPAHNITLHAVWNCTRIRTAEDFVSFSKVVNSGANTFNKATVFLDADIDVPYHLSWQFNPIGNTTIANKYFQGTFDGQGHIISNLTIISNLQYSGLFGYSYYGMTIKNVILDKTYSITSYYDYGDTYLGGLIGYCYSVSAPCNIENSLNMGSVTFDGNTGSYTLYLGGIAGNIQYSSSYVINIKNCANYGSVINSGKRSTSYIGGIVGRFYGYSSSKYGNIQNCLNHGAITHSGTTSNLYIGGITGCNYYSNIINCASLGTLSLPGTITNNYKGSIVGYTDSYTNINYCYWVSNMGISTTYGDGSPQSTSNSKSQSINPNLISLLNNKATTGFNKWFLNTNNATITFIINSDTTFSLSSQVILFPSMSDGDIKFYGWYTDLYCTAPFQSVQIPENTTLYSLYGTIIAVSFNPNFGKVALSSKIILVNDTYGALPTPSRERYTFTGWYTDPSGGTLVNSSTIVSRTSNHTLYAHWIITKYTISFEPNGGSECPNITQAYETSFTLPETIKTGYTFIRWCTDVDLTTEYTATRIEQKNVILYAHWNPNNYTVTLDANGGDKLVDVNTTVTFDNTYNSLPTPNRNGYSFLGWFTDKNEIISKDTVVSIADNHTLYAHWDANNYTVTLDVNGGDKLVDVNTTVTFDGTYALLPTPNRDGYSFLGWLTDKNEIISKDTIVNITDDVTLYAHWNPNNYTVSLVVNGGDGLTNINITVTFDNTYYSLPTPNRDGYSFLGWFTDKNEIISKDTIVSIADNHTLYAHWDANNYTVTLVVNGGNELTNINITVSFDSAYDSLPTPNRDGYSFLGWLTDKNEIISKDAIVSTTDNHTLYAHWDANNYTVTLDVNGGDGLTNINITVTFDSAYDSLPTPNREGYSFLGWFTSLSNGNNASDKITTVTIPEDHTTYALWVINNYTVLFKSSGKEVARFVLGFSDRIIYPNENPSKTFYKFKKWCTESDTDLCNVTYVPAHDLTFVASFDVDLSLVAGTTAGILAVLFIIFLILIIIFLVKVIAVNKLRLHYESVDIELDEDFVEHSEEFETRIYQQIEAAWISKSIKERIEKSLKKADKSKGLDEVLMDLEVDCENGDSANVIESFRTTSAVKTIATALRTKKNTTHAAEYLILLFTTARKQEEYQSFSDLYFGMKDVNDFMDKMDEKNISFGGIVSGFTNKKKVIQFLMTKEGDENMPSGVLFRVQNGQGYRIGKIDEDTEEVLFELGCSFRVDSIKEITKDRYIVVNLSLISPASENDMIEL